MNDAQQEMSPDFVLMRLVSAAEYDRLDEPDDLMSVKAALGHRGGGFELDSGGSSAGLGSASPHYSSPLPGKGELDGGLVLPQAPPGSDVQLSPPPPEDFAVAAQRFVDFPMPHGAGGHGSRAQLMVFQNLLRSGDRILECGLEQPPPLFLQEEAERRRHQLDAGSGPGSTTTPQQGVSALDSESRSVLCHRHRLLSDRLGKWPPGLLDQALHLGLLKPRKNCSGGRDDPVLSLAQRLGHLGEGGEGGEKMVMPLSRCNCLSVLATGSVGLGPGEDPSETSDALLVLEGLGSEEVAGLGEGAHRDRTNTGDTEKEERLGDVGGGGTPGGQQSRSQPQSRATTPKLGVALGAPGRSASPLVVLQREAGAGGREGEKTPRGRSRKGGSLKVRLSKLFRTKSSSGGSGGMLDKRPSLASSISSGGSLLDVWGSTCSNTEQDSSRLQVSRPHSAFSPVPFSPAFTGETVSLVDVDISRRGGNSLHPPTPPPPPRRSLSLLDDFGGPPQQQGPFTECNVGASMQSLPPRPLVLPPSLSTIQHSLSLNDTFLRGLPRPVPLRSDGLHPPPRLVPRCPLSRPDANSFATSLRELEKCGWYWGPMNWEDAEMKLKGKPDGSFLVRDSSDPRYILSLSFRSQGVTHHTRMEHYRGTFSLWCHPKFEDRCHSVVEFIERAIMHSKNGKFLYFLRSRVPGLPPTPVQLLYPVSRFSSVKSLQHLCRFCIRQLVRIDHIQELPLPTPLIAYLRKFYYYDPEEEISPSLRRPEQSSQPGVEAQT
uniref:Suppressor of cytokine signaling 7 n=1 Tax=Echeneis naucrates TaxID=173247 RepID=A0A665WXV8_ECHNA